MAEFINYILESPIQPVKTNVLWVKNGVAHYYNKKWKPLIGSPGGGSGTESPLVFSEGENSAVINYSESKALNGFSIALGFGLISNNYTEAAFGKFNNSVKSSNEDEATLFSVGNGTEINRSNAFEIKESGKVFIYGINKSVQDYLNDAFSDIESKISNLITEDNLNDFENSINTDIELFKNYVSSKLKSFSTSLTSLEEDLIELDNKIGKLNLDLSSTKKELEDKILENSTTISITAESIMAEVQKTAEYLNGRITSSISTFQQTADEIMLSVEEFKKYTNGEFSKVRSEISQTADSITLEIQRVEASLSGDITKLSSKIEQTESSIKQVVTSYEELDSRIKENSAQIELNKDSIVSKVEQTEFDALSGEVNNKFTEVNQTLEGVSTSIKNTEGQLTEINQTVNGLGVRLGTTEAEIESLKKQSDGRIETHFGTVKPTLDNEPAINWGTDDDKREHIGDLYYNNETGEAYRFSFYPDTNTYGWIVLTDSALIEALESIAKLEQAIDGKVTIFYSQPYNYKYGDLWFVEKDYPSFKKGVLVTSTNMDTSTIREAFYESDWVEKLNYVNPDQLSESLETLNTYVNGAFKDGVLSEAEIQQIKELKKNFELEHEELSENHKYLLLSAYASEESKRDLTTSKNNLDKVYNSLITAINNLNTALDPETGENKSLNTYNTAYTDYINALKSYIEYVNILQESVQSYLNAANQYIENISSDGNITPIEKRQLLAIWKSLSEEFNANRGIAYNYKILTLDSNGNYVERLDIYKDHIYYNIYSTYAQKYEHVKFYFTTDVFGLSDLTTTTTLPSNYSITKINEALDNYYSALRVFSEMISEITIRINDAHQVVIDKAEALADQLKPEDNITWAEKGVVLSSVLGVQSNGELQAVINGSDDIEAATNNDRDKKIVFAGGITNENDWSEASTVIYEDGHVKMLSGEIGEQVSIGSAILTSIVKGDINLLAYPLKDKEGNLIKLVPLFTVETDPETGEILAVSTPYNFYSTQEISALGLNAGNSGGEGHLMIDDLIGVSLKNKTKGDILIYNGTHWVNVPQSTLTPDIDLSDYITEDDLNEVKSAILGEIEKSYAKKGTSLESYGINNAYTKEEIDSKNKTLQESITTILDWFTLEDDVLLTKYNLASEKEVSAKGINASQGSGTSYNRLDSWSAYDNNKAGYVLSALLGYDLHSRVTNLENAEVDLSDYYTKSQTNSQIASAIGAIDLSPYATKAALSTLQGQHDALRSEFDALNNLLSSDTTDYINTWNEVVAFLDGYKDESDLATILSGMNADISSRLLTSTFDSWKADTYTPLANLVANHTTKLNSIDTSITNINTRLEGVDKTIEDHIAEFIAFRANFEISDDLILVRKNFASTEEVSAKGINQGTGGGGGSSYSRLDTWESYDNNKAGYVLSAGLGYGLKVAVDELNGYDLDNRVRSIENSYVSKDAGGVVNGGLVVSSLAIAGGSSSQFLKADGSLDSTSYLPTSGGTINGYFGAFSVKRYEPYASAIKFENSVGILGYIGINDAYTPLIWDKDLNTRTLLHSGNIGSYNAGGLTEEFLDDLNNATGGRFFISGFQAANRPNGAVNYGTGVTFKYSDIGAIYQLAYDTYGGLYSRYKVNNSWSNWKTIAFTDSNITGNAGGLKTGASHLYAQHNDTDKYIVFGYQTARNGYFTIIDGTSITFRDGGSNPTMLINSSGNVLIGITEDDGSGAKLQVSGGISAYFDMVFTRQSWNFITVPSSGGNLAFNVGSPDLANTKMCLTNGGNVGIGTTNPQYRLDVAGDVGITSTNGYIDLVNGQVPGNASLTLSVNGTSYARIQTSHYGVAYTCPLYINPSGGNVLIGTTEDNGAKLQVDGDVKLRCGFDSVIGSTYDIGNSTLYNYIKFGANESGLKYYSGAWTSGNVLAHEFIVGANASVLSIMNNGHVIIGNAKDNGYKLHVDGSLYAGAATLSSLYVSSDIVTESITIGGATLSWENGALKVNTSFYSEKEISAKGLSTGGGSGASYNRLDAWGDYDSSKAGYVLSAGLGYDLKLAVDELNGYNLNSRLTTVESNYLSKNGGVATNLTVSGAGTAWIHFEQSGFTYGSLGINAEHNAVFHDTTQTRWLLHSGNIGNYAMQYYGTNMPSNNVNYVGYGKPAEGWYDFGPAISFGYGAYYAQMQMASDGSIYSRISWEGSNSDWKTLAFAEDVLSTSGGTIGGSLTVDSSSLSPLLINTSHSSGIGLRLAQNHTLKAEFNWDIYAGTYMYNHPSSSYIGVKDDGTPHYNGNTLIHSGNIGSQSVAYATNAGGTQGSTSSINFARGHNRLEMINSLMDGTVGDFAYAYQSGISVITEYVGWQMTSYGGATENPYFRSLEDTGRWKPWRQLAFIDDNVASATKLATSRTIWGQSFDGTDIVDGDLHMHTSAIYFNSDKTNYNMSCNGTTVMTYDMYGGHKFCTYGEGQRMLINHLGNVTIGASDLAYVYSKLHVDGDVVAKSFSNDMTDTHVENGIARPWYGLSVMNPYETGVWLSGYSGIYIKTSSSLLTLSSSQFSVDCASYLGGNTTINGSLSAGATTLSSLTVSGLSTFTGGVVAYDIHGNGQSLYLGNASNNAFIKVREDMVGSSSMWSIPRDGKATFTSLTTPTLSVTGSATIANVTIDAGNATLSNLTVNTAATLKQLVVGIDGMSCNGPATFNDFIYGSSITPRTDNYYVLGNNNYKWYAVTAYNVNVHDAITIEAGKELRFKDDNGVVHTLKYDSDKEAFVFDGNVNATGEISAKKLNA